MDCSEILALARRHGLDPRKTLGQHFLISEGAVRAIVDAVGHVGGVLEVGPGPGVLTSPLSARFPVVAVELDARAVPVLAASAPSAQVLVMDALAAPLGELLARLPGPRAIVSNMPYNITGPLLERFDSLRGTWALAVLMMQREVAQKILAQPGDAARGALSVIFQARYTIAKVCDVPPGAFYPPPKVTSTVLRLTPTETEMEDGFVELVRAGFGQPRKTLANNLAAGGYDRSLIAKAGLDERVRPHQLTQPEWLALLRL